MHKKAWVEESRRIAISDLQMNDLSQLKNWAGLFHIMFPSREKVDATFLLRKKDKIPTALEMKYVSIDEEGREDIFELFIEFVSTPSNYGGRIWWFICPQNCGRKVRHLYIDTENADLGCRECCDLTYESRNLQGPLKAFGKIIPLPTLEEWEAKIKRKRYNGKPTREYRRFRKALEKNWNATSVATARRHKYS